MNSFWRFFFFLLLVPSFIYAQKRPKIGLALSGGGAKGLAHIGLLKAIDSVGINIDYVSGTSMGAIVGGLYAAGYSANEIEKFAREMDWNRILSNKPQYKQLLLPQKQGAEQFLEVPLVHGKPHFGKGVLESNELWLFLTNHFFGYLTESDFTKFPRPFRCVATRLDNGDVVILKDGSIVRSIRASMAIPSVFTPVSINENMLIDGGLVRNFPVSETKEMGADLVIGSSVADGLLTSDDLDNPFQMLSQIAFYGEQRDYKEQVEASDIFVDYPLGKFNAGSFSSANDIVELGIKRGEEVFQKLKNLKDSLDQIYGVEEFRKLTPKTREKIKVSKFIATGLDSPEYAFLMKRLNFREGHEYTPAEISERIRTSFATGIFRKINYDLEENEDGSVKVHLNFEKDYGTFIKVGLGYNTETGLGLKLGATWYGLLGPFSSSSVVASIGENPQVAARNVYFFDKQRSLYLETNFNTGLTDIANYNENLSKIGIYNQRHFNIEMNMFKLLTRNLAVGAGTRYEFLKYKPEILTYPEAQGKINFLNSYLALKFNNQDMSYNPHSGNLINLEVGAHYGQNPDFTYKVDAASPVVGAPADLKNYFTVRYYSAHYFPVYKHTVFLKLNSGMHFGNKLPYMNDFLIGGNNFVVRNQVLFSGFRLNAISSSSVATSQLGYRYNFTPRLSLAAASSFLVYGFVSNNYASKTKTVIGFDLTAGYKSFIGPIEISVLYNSINDKLITTFNVGYSLNFSK